MPDQIYKYSLADHHLCSLDIPESLLQAVAASHNDIWVTLFANNIDLQTMMIAFVQNSHDFWQTVAPPRSPTRPMQSSHAPSCDKIPPINCLTKQSSVIFLVSKKTAEPFSYRFLYPRVFTVFHYSFITFSVYRFFYSLLVFFTVLPSRPGETQPMR